MSMLVLLELVDASDLLAEVDILEIGEGFAHHDFRSPVSVVISRKAGHLWAAGVKSEACTFFGAGEGFVGFGKLAGEWLAVGAIHKNGLTD